MEAWADAKAGTSTSNPAATQPALNIRMTELPFEPLFFICAGRRNRPSAQGDGAGSMGGVERRRRQKIVKSQGGKTDMPNKTGTIQETVTVSFN
jgi:hypothetical protein